MNKLLVLFTSFFFAFSVHAEIDVSAGKEKATTVCAACHNADGNSVNGIWPKLAGQHPEYLLQQMLAFKEGKKRSDPSMIGMMAPLSVDDMKNLAAYYSQQKPVIGYAAKENLSRGEMIYRGGDSDKKISACIACHGPRGLGNRQAGFPRLSGQHAHYIVEELEDYSSGKRQTDINSIMRDIASRMDKEDMKAVANYISGLH